MCNLLLLTHFWRSGKFCKTRRLAHLAALRNPTSACWRVTRYVRPVNTIHCLPELSRAVSTQFALIPSPREWCRRQKMGRGGLGTLMSSTCDSVLIRECIMNPIRALSTFGGGLPIPELFCERLSLYGSILRLTEWTYTTWCILMSDTI